MKRLLGGIICLLSSMALFGCSGMKTVRGEVVDSMTDPDIGGIMFVLRDSSGNETGFALTDETSIKSNTSKISAAEFKESLPCHVILKASYNPLERGGRGSWGQDIVTYNVYKIVITGVSDEFNT